MVRSFSRALAAAALAISSVAASAQGTAAVPVAAFFQDAAFAGAELSPTGKQVAIRVTPKSGRVQLVVIDTETLAAKAVAGYTNADIDTFHWINDKRLVFTLADREGGMVYERAGSPGLFAVDGDGSDLRELAHVSWNATSSTNALSPAARFHSATRNLDSDDIFVTMPSVQGSVQREVDALNLLRLNTRTGRSTGVARPANTIRWLMDANDVPRVAVTRSQGRGAVLYLDPANSKWLRLAEYDEATGRGGVSPVGLGPDGTLYVNTQNLRNEETSAIHRYDMERRRIDPAPLVTVKGFDLSASLMMDKTRVVGIRYVSDALGTVWFDQEHKDLQARVDGILRATNNVLSVSLRPEVPVTLVWSFSDKEPGFFSLYNAQTGKLTVLGRAMPDIEPARMGEREFVRYKARDGLEIPGWLTLPPGGAQGRKLPMVVLVHGGPYLRGGRWEWKADSQFLASRGYAVLEPEFRGSRGYGFAHFRAGWKQWGLAMQNDVADGARWMIEKGIVDPARICIAGASYGGYSALMGLVNDPDLFRCGINWVGVTDIDLLYSVSWSDTSTEYKTYGMPVLVGDREKDAEQLKATSPLLQAARIKQPLLLAYGARGRRVPIVHGVKFRDEVQKTNAQVEWIEYPEEGHGWYLVKNRIDFWTRVEKFLDKSIGKP